MPETILLVDDQRMVRDHLASVLTARGYEVATAATGDAALRMFAKRGDELSLVILDLDLGAEPDGLGVLKQMKADQPDVPVIMLSGKGTIQTAVQALKLGAADFLEKGLCLEEQLDASVEKLKRLIAAIEENKRLRDENERLLRRAELLDDMLRRKYQIVGESQALRDTLALVDKIASIPRPVLIVGERGCGKELIAAAIHYRGARAGKPFVTVNCAAFHGELLESEMFGHEKGAFTGAVHARKGIFEQADGGTLLLDEIGETSLAFQVKLLRVLQEGEIRTVGSDRAGKVDVRILSATNSNIPMAIEKGEFREDLYYRLNVMTIRLPPLAERIDDAPLLAMHFLARAAAKVRRPVEGFTEMAMAKIVRYSWPGNVRELENMVESAVYSASIRSDEGKPVIVDVSDFPTLAEKVARNPRRTRLIDVPFYEARAEFEKTYLAELLERNNFNIAAASRMGKVSRKSLTTKAREYGLIA